MTRDEFTEIAWRDFITFAAQDQDILRQFTAETGLHFPREPANGLEAMIDKATGFDARADMKAIMARFVRWATVRHWGVEYAPASLRAELTLPEPLPPNTDNAPNGSGFRAEVRPQRTGAILLRTA